MGVGDVLRKIFSPSDAVPPGAQAVGRERGWISLVERVPVTKAPFPGPTRRRIISGGSRGNAMDVRRGDCDQGALR